MSLGYLSDRKIRILNFDDSLLSQKNLIRKFTTPAYAAEVVDFKKEAPYLRYWSKREELDLIKQKIGLYSKNTITLYGSGDFHHISIALIEQFQEPISVIVFDYHPDWDGLPPQLSCGSWVNAIVKNENIKKVILLGPSSEDLSSKNLFSASFWGLNNKKLKIFPYSHKPSKIFLKYLKNTNCIDLERGLISSTIKWKNLAEIDMHIFLSDLLCRLPTENVYVSIDKDCLSREYALTNWEEGPIRIEWLLEALSIIKSKKNIVGLDITGDYSPVFIKSWLKKIISSLDHPKEIDMLKDSEKANSINETTNLKILQLFIE